MAVERVRTTDEMARAVLARLEESTVVIMTAAVADFRPAGPLPGKLKKHDVTAIQIEPTRDILSEIAALRRADQLVVGFAAETDHVLENAAAKLRLKRLDMMVANDVTQYGAGFEVDTNIVTLLFPGGGAKALEKMSKFDVANRILDEVIELRKAGVRSQAPGVRTNH